MHTARSLVPVVVLAAALSMALAPPIVAGEAPAVAAPSGPAASVTSVSNTAGHLAPNATDVRRDELDEARLDVAGAVAADAERLRGRYRTVSLREAFQGTETQSERVAVVRDELAVIEARVASLETRQERAIARYGDGSMTTREYLREIALVDAGARQVKDRLGVVHQDTSARAGFSLPNELRTRVDNVEADMVSLRGSVRAAVGDALAGEGPTPVYALTGEESIVLATTDDRRFVREAVLGGERVDGTTDAFAIGDRPRISAAYQRAADLYTWAFNNSLSPPSATGFGTTSVYRIHLEHSHGELTTYIDGTTRNAFREVQTTRPAELPATTVTNETDSLVLRVNRTYATGPMRVALERPDTGTPISGEVRVGDGPPLRTGQDGVVWTVQPVGVVEVNATSAGGDGATVTLSP